MEIHRADPAYRNRALLMLAFTALCCVVVLLVLQAWLQRVSAELLSSDPETLRHWLRGLLSGLGLGLAVPAALLGMGLRRLGNQAAREQRFPPQQWKTLRDVRVLRGPAAARWSVRTVALGTIAIALATFLVAWALWVLWRFA
ncbi:MAG: hypothetical protein JWL98_926 [Xanthomonadaceae bacterium]|nr:hypothetical protein [Xanthomonadaceae bacterium]